MSGWAQRDAERQEEECEQLQEDRKRLDELELQVKEANRLIAEFANGTMWAYNTITQLLSELAECKHREAILLTAIQRIKNWDFIPDSIEIVEIAQKAWDETRPERKTE